MGKLLEFIKNREPIKLAIIRYQDKEIDIINLSRDYYDNHWSIFRRKKDKNKLSEREFFERLYNFIWIEKVSELLIILYLEDLQGNYPTIYELNRFLRRTSNQYSATIKEVKKLEKLDIVCTKPKPNSKRKEKQIFIKKDIIKIYGDDEFRQMMLDEWDTDAKEYIKRKLEGLKKQKEEFEKKLLLIKRGKMIIKRGI